ncbi:cellular tumor antigen p53-like isoform X2 [Zophobas morio]|uniref:cellular tumor antigen p53-like isoform X2 n=1 Tax=Zophobas morio TaxID=2755281 RepID=UPI003083D928
MVVSETIEDFKYIQDANYMSDYQPFPPSEPQQLCNSDYAGPYAFEVFVDPNVMKNPWEYSALLNKIYIDMKHKFPINFSVKSHDPEQKMFVRVMPMFEEDRYFQEPVHRCICHGQAQDPTNNGVSELVAQHIIRCDNPNARYFGDKNLGRRLSVVIPLSSPQVGTDSVKEFFHFVCKNSCVGGMNRRPIQIVFTLEDVCGTVRGRRVLCVRICSCPKRDREKEEKKREQENHSTTSSKKRRVDKKLPAPPSPPTSDNTDTRIFPLQLDVVGKENYKQMLKFCQTLMSNEIYEAKSANLAPFEKCREQVTQMLNTIPE